MPAEDAAFLLRRALYLLQTIGTTKIKTLLNNQPTAAHASVDRKQKKGTGTARPGPRPTRTPVFGALPAYELCYSPSALGLREPDLARPRLIR